MELLITVVRWLLRRLTPYSVQLDFEFLLADIKSRSQLIMGVPAKYLLLQVMIALPCLMMLPVIKFTVMFKGYAISVYPTGVILVLLIVWPLVRKVHKFVERLRITLSGQLRYLGPATYAIKAHPETDDECVRLVKTALGQE